MAYLDQENNLMVVKKEKNISLLNMRNLKILQAIEEIENKKRVGKDKGKSKRKDRIVWSKYPTFTKLKNIHKKYSILLICLLISSVLLYILTITTGN